MQQEWFILIFNKYIDDVYRLAFSYTHNKADSDDITQKVFLKFYNNIYKINKNNESAKKWLIVTTINECKDLFKSSWKKIVIPIDDDSYISKDKFDIDNKFNYYLDKLPLKYRLVFHLYYFYGYDVKEISKITKIREGTIRQRLSRGRKILKIERENEYERF